jgi:site-specific DNA-methyltransferase (adenine-specific)
MRSRLSDGSVDVVVTSPPYNLGVRYATYDDRRPEADYFDWIERVGDEIARVLSADGSFFLNVGSAPQNPWLPWDVAQRLRGRFILQNHIVWAKSLAVPGQDGATRSVGHFKPVNSERFLNGCHESLFHFTKTGRVVLDRLAVGVPYEHKSNIARWNRPAQDRRCRGNIWFVPYQTIVSRERDRPHPASFPPALAEMCVRLHGVERTRRVLDPFVGIGSTAVACRALKVPFIGFDIDAGYLRVAEERLDNGVLL